MPAHQVVEDLRCGPCSIAAGYEVLQDALDALEACSAKGAARALCTLAASSFRAATLLGMTCEEAASLGPRQSLQILLMKGPQAAPVSTLPILHP